MLSGKKILVGVTGGIAAYKAAFLVRLLVKSGAEVNVVMTPSACSFISPLTLSTLSRNPVGLTFEGTDGTWNSHVSLGLWADCMIIAPATANTIAKMAGGLCDNLLLATYLSSRCPVYIAPAMDLDMYVHAATQENLRKLKSQGVKIIAPAKGELASGLQGEGRMQEPEYIVAFLKKEIAASLPLKGIKALVTAGPTCEAIDPVRFIGNHSSGKMGYAVAEALAGKGAEVHLVSGPVPIHHENKLITRVDVTTAAEMNEACKRLFPSSHIAVMAAAVADYRPVVTAGKKIKKKDSALHIALEPTTDILSGMGKVKKKKQLLVGFALETDRELVHAKEKLKKKNLDLIILNSLRDRDAGFRYDTNKVTLIDRNNKIKKTGLLPKREIAEIIAEKIITLLDRKK